MQKRVQTASQDLNAMNMELQKINEDKFKEKLNYKNHKRIFNPKNKGAFTHRGSNREIETQESSYRISRGNKRTVINCNGKEDHSSDLPTIPTVRRYQNNQMVENYLIETDSLSTNCLSNDQSEPDSTQSMNAKYYKSLNESDITKILNSCGNDIEKMMNICKDMLKNCNNPDVKALLKRKL